VIAAPDATPTPDLGARLVALALLAKRKGAAFSLTNDDAGWHATIDMVATRTSPDPAAAVAALQEAQGGAA
jgi:hypothetical protein